MLAKLAEQGARRGNGGTSANSPTAPALPAVRTPAPVLVPAAKAVQLVKLASGTTDAGFQVPGMWAWDDGKRREPALDVDRRFPARVVRSVGWNTCLGCAQPFFSEDVVGIRMCESCKTLALARDWLKKNPLRVPQARSGGPG